MNIIPEIDPTIKFVYHDNLVATLTHEDFTCHRESIQFSSTKEFAEFIYEPLATFTAWYPEQPLVVTILGTTR